MNILKAKIKKTSFDNDIEIIYDSANIPAVKEITGKVLASLNPDSEELKEYKEAEIEINVDELQKEQAEISITGDTGAVFVLCGYILGELNKKTNGNLLDAVTIRADYVKKYQEWAKEIALEHKNISPEDIKDEEAEVDKQGNLIISIGIKDKTFNFIIPEEAWSF